MSVDWRQIDTVILDMDGTILDLHFDNFLWGTHLPDYLARTRGLELEAVREHVMQQLQRARGSYEWYSLAHWSEVFDVNLYEMLDELAPLVRPRYDSFVFLSWLSQQRQRALLFTNADSAMLRFKLGLLGFDRWFADCISALDYRLIKQQTEAWELLCRHFSLVPECTLFIDDNFDVLATAHRAGVAHLWTIAQPDCERPVRTPEEVLALAEQYQMPVPGVLQRFAEIVPGGLASTSHDQALDRH